MTVAHSSAGRLATPSIHIIIVNWNTGDYLRNCLSSIVAAETTGLRLERVTVVDNASVDDSASGLDDLPLPLELMRNARNMGFAAACNQGAGSSEADFLLFLNPDTQLLPGTLVRVTRFMQSEQAQAIGICGVESVDRAGHPMISCARFPTLRVLFGKMFRLHRTLPGLFPSHHLLPRETRQSRVVDQVIGAFFFVRSDLFSRLGGFDERYFLYFEEVDFALRARKHGKASYFLKTAKIVHEGNVSSTQVVDVRLYHSLRSRLVFARRHWQPWQAGVLLALTLTVEPALRLARAALSGNSSEFFATGRGYRMLVGDLSALQRGAPSPEAR
jgi:N-acetylglucosaminyl-diphospho-decaprenol L-rhamnosyltransferase